MEMMNLDEKTARKMLDEVKESLEKNEAEHEVLAALLKGLEGWLRLNMTGSDPAPAQKQLIVAATNGAIGTISFRKAVLEVIKSARGEPIHVKEILHRAKQMGAVTNAKNPEGITDLHCHSWAESGDIKRTNPRTYKWMGNR